MASSIVSMLVGYASGYTSPAADSVIKDLKLTDDQVSIVPSKLVPHYDFKSGKR